MRIMELGRSYDEGIAIRHSAFGIRHSQASALIVVLWVIGLLSLLVCSFTFDAHVESKITSYYRKRTKAEYLARSGTEIAEMFMTKSTEMRKSKSKTEEEEKEDWWREDAKRLAEGLAIRGLEHELGEGKIILDIVPEPARRNINKLGSNDNEKEENLERILEVANIPEDMWPELIESFLDWTDKDDVARVDGAETEDYYATLEAPYRAKNGPLDTVGELLLVKGFDRTILSGGVIETGFSEGSSGEDEEPIIISGIEDLLTTHGDGKVNVNAASADVLMTLPEVDELVASAIIEEREGWIDEEGQKEDSSFKDINDFFMRISGLDPSLKNYITTDSTIYRVTSVGTVHGVKRKVLCIMEYGGSIRNINILRWREEE